MLKFIVPFLISFIFPTVFAADSDTVSGMYNYQKSSETYKSDEDPVVASFTEVAPDSYQELTNMPLPTKISGHFAAGFLGGVGLSSKSSTYFKNDHFFVDDFAINFNNSLHHNMAVALEMGSNSFPNNLSLRRAVLRYLTPGQHFGFDVGLLSEPGLNNIFTDQFAAVVESYANVAENVSGIWHRHGVVVDLNYKHADFTITSYQSNGGHKLDSMRAVWTQDFPLRRSDFKYSVKYVMMPRGDIDNFSLLSFAAKNGVSPLTLTKQAGGDLRFYELSLGWKLAKFAFAAKNMRSHAISKVTAGGAGLKLPWSEKVNLFSLGAEYQFSDILKLRIRAQRDQGMALKGYRNQQIIGFEYAKWPGVRVSSEIYHTDYFGPHTDDYALVIMTKFDF